jgi:hypothetical protein
LIVYAVPRSSNNTYCGRGREKKVLRRRFPLRDFKDAGRIRPKGDVRAGDGFQS